MDKKRKKSKEKLRSKSKSHTRKKSKTKNINKQPQKPVLEFIRSKYILKGILLYIPLDTRFEIIKCNKSIMEKCGYNKESKEMIKELVNRASLDELLSENYIFPFLVNKDNNGVKEDYYDIMIYKALKEKQIKLNYVNFFSYLESVEFKNFKLEKFYLFSKDYFQTHDAEFYKNYQDNKNNIVEKYFECLDVLFNSLIINEKCDFSLTFDNLMEKGNLLYKGKYFETEKYDEFIEKHIKKIKNINISQIIYNYSANNQQKDEQKIEQNKSRDLLEKFLNKTQNLKMVNINNNIVNALKILLPHDSFKNLEIISVNIDDYGYTGINEFFTFITNNPSTNILVLKSSPRLFLDLVNKFKINNKIKILLLIKVQSLSQFEQLGKNIINDLFLYVYSENYCFSLTEMDLKMFKVLKFHCKGKLQIKYEHFSLVSSKEICASRKIAKEFLKEHNLEFNFEDEIELKMEGIINNFENELTNKNNYTYEFDDHHKNSSRFLLSLQSLKDEDKENIKNLTYKFLYKNSMTSLLSNFMKHMINLKKIDIQIWDKYDFFFTRYNMILKYLTDIEECSISFQKLYYVTNNNNINIKIEKGKFARKILRECEDLKYFDISKLWFDLEDDEGYIKKLINKKKKKKFSNKLKYIILRVDICERDNEILNIKKEIKRINEECYQDMINGYPKILFFVYDAVRRYNDNSLIINDINEFII